LVLTGIDHWTVSSTSPALRDLPGVTNAVISRLQAAGWENVFRIARSPVAELAYRANLSPDDARAAHEAARLVTLRGIGTAHAAARAGVVAPIQPSTCAAVRAPTIAPVTPGHASVQATATADAVVP